jgi:hypothetical protein
MTPKRSAAGSVRSWLATNVALVVITAALGAVGGGLGTWMISKWPSVSSWLAEDEAVPGWALVLLVVLAVWGLSHAGHCFWQQVRPETKPRPMPSIVDTRSRFNSWEYRGVLWRWTWINQDDCEPKPFCLKCRGVLTTLSLNDLEHRDNEEYQRLNRGLEEEPWSYEIFYCDACRGAVTVSDEPGVFSQLGGLQRLTANAIRGELHRRHDKAIEPWANTA